MRTYLLSLPRTDWLLLVLFRCSFYIVFSYYRTNWIPGRGESIIVSMGQETRKSKTSLLEIQWCHTCGLILLSLLHSGMDSPDASRSIRLRSQSLVCWNFVSFSCRAGKRTGNEIRWQSVVNIAIQKCKKKEKERDIKKQKKNIWSSSLRFPQKRGTDSPLLWFHSLIRGCEAKAKAALDIKKRSK